MHRARVATALLAFTLAAGSAHAQTTSTASPAATTPMTTTHIARYVNDARLAGEGKLTWLGFHVYDARLYAPTGFDVSNPFAQQFVLELTYARKLEGKAIAEASRDEMQRLAIGSSEQHTKWLAQMEKLFPNVEKGRRIAGVNQPGQGARFYVDGNFVGSVDEPDFARAFFAIWLDPRTRAPRLRESLLKAGGATAAIAP